MLKYFVVFFIFSCGTSWDECGEKCEPPPCPTCGVGETVAVSVENTVSVPVVVNVETTVIIVDNRPVTVVVNQPQSGGVSTTDSGVVDAGAPPKPVVDAGVTPDAGPKPVVDAGTPPKPVVDAGVPKPNCRKVCVESKTAWKCSDSKIYEKEPHPSKGLCCKQICVCLKEALQCK
jgi:hypothetical protein